MEVEECSKTEAFNRTAVLLEMDRLNPMILNRRSRGQAILGQKQSEGPGLFFQGAENFNSPFFLIISLLF